MLMPIKGSLERIFLDKAIEKIEGVTYLDFIGTGITEENIDGIANNLRTCMFVAENDHEVIKDS